MQVENTDILLKDVRNNFDKIYVLYYSRMFRFAKEYVLFDEDAGEYSTGCFSPVVGK